jgi:glycosyltransferase involved in cell wall biosynthesis
VPRRRVVLSAFACSPARGSEPGIGWNIATRLGAYHDITILCCPNLADENYRAEIENYLQKHGPIPGVTFHYVAPPLLSRLFQRPLISFAAPLYFLGYAAWQRQALAEARRLHAQNPFDLAHQLTITGFREPSYLWKLPIPFIWGPVAGASNIPWPFFKTFSLRDRAFYTLKNLLNELHKRSKPRPRRAARAAKAILATSEEDRCMISRHFHADSKLMLDTGTPDLQGTPRHYDGSRPLKLLWSGLHVGRKALPIALTALSNLNDPQTRARWELKILGAGRETAHWQSMSRRLAIDDRITWTGYIPRDVALSEMGAADVFVFTSLQEGTSTVVMEALALGLPVICHNACGMGVAVTETCGLKISLQNPKKSATDFAAAIQSLLTNPTLVPTLSAGALERSKELSWDHKARDIAEIYNAAFIPSPGTHPFPSPGTPG